MMIHCPLARAINAHSLPTASRELERTRLLDEITHNRAGNKKAEGRSCTNLVRPYGGNMLRERFEKETGESIRHNTWVDHNRKYEKWLESLVTEKDKEIERLRNTIAYKEKAQRSTEEELAALQKRIDDAPLAYASAMTRGKVLRDKAF